MVQLRSDVQKRKQAVAGCLGKHALSRCDDCSRSEGDENGRGGMALVCDGCAAVVGPGARECLACKLRFCETCGGAEENFKPARRSGRQSRPANRVRFSSQMKSLFSDNGVKPALPRANIKQVHRNPAVYVIENFLTESELEHLDQLQQAPGNKGKNSGSFSRSYTQDLEGSRVVSSHRTSAFVYLKKFGDPKVRAIERRAADLVGLPTENVEPLQVVRYKEGQYFGLHHDCGELLDDGIVIGSESGAGSRLVTFFVYLNTVDVKNGGTTFFPKLRSGKGLHVRPQRGSAVLWSNLLEDGEVDPRVIHEALPTKNGQRKFGMNIWISPFSMLDYSLSKSGLVLPTLKRASLESQGEARPREEHGDILKRPMVKKAKATK